jgi:twitching motility protein PilJ
MPSGTDSKYNQLYGQAYSAYCKGDYVKGMAIADKLIADYPDNSNLLLLRGHMYLQLQKFTEARSAYEEVLRVGENAELINHARQGLTHVDRSLAQVNEMEMGLAETEGISMSEPSFEPRESFAEDSEFEQNFDPEQDSHSWDMDDLDWDSGVFTDDGLDEPTIGKVSPFHKAAVDEDEDEDGPTSFLPNARSLSGKEEENPFTDAEDEPEWQNSLNGGVDQAFDFEQFAETGDSTFVVSSDLRGSSLSRPKPQRSSPPNRAPERDEYSLNESESYLLDNLTHGDDLEMSELGRSALESASFYTSSADSSFSSELQTKNRHRFDTDYVDSQQTLTDFAGDDSMLPNGGAEALIKPTVDVPLGFTAPFINSSLNKKHLFTALAAGLIPPVMILLVSTGSWLSSLSSKNAKPTPSKEKTTKVSKAKTPPTNLYPWSREVLWMSLLSGVGSFGMTFFLAGMHKRIVKQTVRDLKEQFETVKNGNFNVRAKIYSEDELGQLSAQFNDMSRIVSTTINSAQRRASETEQAQEDLQRQVIRLLDDVEGAARGDLTIEAEVTADVLGAVADAFNSTIQNLREIVSQVKKAAEQVHKGSTDSESFARNQSKDALKMAEELAATLNSVQMMTESIKRVAENAHEAEEVARTSSITALKGGEAVETTVGGILQIRETVSETARKVKRLAEASQEISKIVALISQIASRTNLLALNASIQAARAGEAGRGFAIVADEVRQLADRSAKSLKEIEQIVLQIQSETGSVMTAMEEGIQQVIAVTEQSEQAKKSLEDIIQVSNRIDTLVRSISADTVKQKENSRDVTQVMESVELTAQETSQESQRVAGSLQNLVAISRNLLDSVERFKIDSKD